MNALLDILSAPGEYTRGLLAGRPGERLSGTDMLRNWGVDAGEGPQNALLDLLVGIPTDPLTYAIPGAAALAGRLAKAARGLSVSKAMPLRKGVTFVKNADDTQNMHMVGGYRDAAGSIDNARLNEVADTLVAADRQGAAKSAFGYYAPKTRVGAVMSDIPDPRNTMRHELTHSLINRAADTGNAAGLPLGWKAAAAMKSSPDDFVHTLGNVADEMAGHGAGGFGAWRFLQEPIPEYANVFAKTSPIAAAIYEGRYIPRAAGAAAGLAGAAAAGYGMKQMGW